MASPGQVRGGGVYVEITADDRPMVRRLQESQERLRRWATEASGVTMNRGSESAAVAQSEDRKGFLSGGFRGVQILDTGMKFVTAVKAVQAIIKDVHVFSALVRGDFDGMRKAAEDLPLGLGSIVKELGTVADAAAKAFVFRLKGVDDSAYGPSNRKDVLADVEQYNRGVTAIHAAQQALDKATMSAREYAKAEVDGLKLSAEDSQRLLGLKLGLIAANEKAAAVSKAKANKERGETAITQAQDEYAKASMTEREYLEYQIRQMGISAEAQQNILNWKLETLRVTEEQKAAEAAAAAEFAQWSREADASAKALGESLQAEVSAYTKNAQDAAALEQEMRTPEEKARDQIAQYQEMLGSGSITQETYDRATRKAVEDAAAATPDAAAAATVGVRGTTSTFEVGAMGAGGAADRLAESSAQTAQSLQRIEQMMRRLGVTFTQ